MSNINRVLIGKDINRSAGVTDGLALHSLMVSTTLADGEVVVLDKDKKVLAAGSTASDSDTIFILQGLSSTSSYTNPAGTVVTVRDVHISDPVEAKGVRVYRGNSYSAKSEETASVNLTGWTPVSDTEYLIKIIYKDMAEYPTQFTQTYRVVATTTTLDTEAAALAAKVNAHSGRRVNASYNSSTNVLTLTARENPECTTGLTDIDKFSMVEFKALFLYVDSDGNFQTIPSTSTTVTYTGPTYGVGNWEQVRDLEKSSQYLEKTRDDRAFPVVSTTFSTVVDSYYDIITIEHDVSYVAPNNQGSEVTPVITTIALATASNGTNAGSQSSDVVSKLNTWMASTPGSFANISL